MSPEEALQQLTQTLSDHLSITESLLISRPAPPQLARPSFRSVVFNSLFWVAFGAGAATLVYQFLWRPEKWTGKRLIWGKERDASEDEEAQRDVKEKKEGKDEEKNPWYNPFGWGTNWFGTKHITYTYNTYNVAGGKCEKCNSEIDQSDNEGSENLVVV